MNIINRSVPRTARNNRIYTTTATITTSNSSYGGGTTTDLTGVAMLSGATFTGTIKAPIVSGSTVYAPKFIEAGTCLDAKYQLSCNAITCSNIAYQHVCCSDVATQAGTAINSTCLNGQLASYYQPASNAITTSNIGAQSVCCSVNSTNATNSTCLNGQLASYYQPASTAINTSNIGSQSVASATNAGSAINSTCLNGQLASYYQTSSNAITTSNIGAQSVCCATVAGSSTNSTCLGGITAAGFAKCGNSTTAELNGVTLAAGLYNNESQTIAGIPSIFNYIINLGDYSGGGYRAQLAVPYESGCNRSMYIRTSVGSTWGDWYQFINSNNISSQCVSYATNSNYAVSAGSAASAGDSTCLNGQLASYYQPASTAINTSNIGSQCVNYAGSANYATCAGDAGNAGFATCSSSANTVDGLITDLGNRNVGLALATTTTFSGVNNTLIGYNQTQAGTFCGCNNTVLGANYGCLNTKSGIVAIGAYAGLYDAASNSFYLNNQDRSCALNDRTKKLLYGVFNSNTASQELTINAANIYLPYIENLGTIGYNVTIGANNELRKQSILVYDLGASTITGMFQPDTTNHKNFKGVVGADTDIYFISTAGAEGYFTLTATDAWLLYWYDDESRTIYWGTAYQAGSIDNGDTIVIRYYIIDDTRMILWAYTA